MTAAATASLCEWRCRGAALWHAERWGRGWEEEGRCGRTGVLSRQSSQISEGLFFLSETAFGCCFSAQFLHLEPGPAGSACCCWNRYGDRCTTRFDNAPLEQAVLLHPVPSLLLAVQARLLVPSHPARVGVLAVAAPAGFVVGRQREARELDRAVLAFVGREVDLSQPACVR